LDAIKLHRIKFYSYRVKPDYVNVPLSG